MEELGSKSMTLNGEGPHEKIEGSKILRLPEHDSEFVDVIECGPPQSQPQYESIKSTTSLAFVADQEKPDAVIKASESDLKNSEFECPSTSQLTKLVEQGKSSVGSVRLQISILQHLIESNAFKTTKCVDFTSQAYYIENNKRFKEKRALVLESVARRKRMAKQKIYQASKDYKRLHDEWQGRSTRGYGRRKLRQRGQDEAQHYKFQVGDVVRSEKEFLETLQSLASADNVSQGIVNMCTSADIPAMMPQAPVPMNNSNGLILDPKEHFYRGANADQWDEQEKALFAEAYLKFPKQFGKIAESLPNRTPSQCVLFYYRTKKTSELKVQLGKKRKAEVQKTRRRSNTFGRKSRGREKNKQSLPLHEPKSKRARKDNQTAPSPAPSSSSHDQLDVVGDKDISKSDFLPDDSLNELEVTVVESTPADVILREVSPVLSQVSVEVVQKELKQTASFSDMPGVTSITKINALLNSPSDNPEPKWDKSAIIEWFGDNNDSAAPETIVPPARPSLTLEIHPYHPPQPTEPPKMYHNTSYGARQPSAPIWNSVQSPSYYSLPPHHQSRPYQHQMHYQATPNIHRQPYERSYYQRPPTYSYRDTVRPMPPHLHQPILPLANPPMNPSRLHPTQGLNSSLPYSRNPNSDPGAPLSSSLNQRNY